jgi:hypothetical protein
MAMAFHAFEWNFRGLVDTTTVQGNFIGTAAGGSRRWEQRIGVSILITDNNRIGGIGAGKATSSPSTDRRGCAT